MFEKVAEFYAREKYSPGTDSFIVAAAEDAFEDGANFGYKWANERHYPAKGGNIPPTPIQVETAQFISEITELNKANEWHYVKDGDLPEENQWVLVYDGSYTVCNYHSNTPIKWLDNYENEVYEGNIIAWKDITPPKEIEENEN